MSSEEIPSAPNGDGGGGGGGGHGITGITSLLEARIWWLVGSLCLPITLPVMIYQVIGSMTQRKRYYELEGKVVMITGASSGLGEALAHSFYAQGCRVVLAARRVQELHRVKQDLLQIHPTVPAHPPIIVPLDLSEINDLQSCVSKVYDIYGHIDILINNGGVSYRGKVLDTKVDVDIKIMLVNYFGPVALTKAVLPRMTERKVGHIVFVSSVQGRIAIPERSAYAASKHALQAFADTLRAEVKQHDIDVSVVSPGYINTALSLNALTAAGDKHGVMDASTASGYTASYVADQILSTVVKRRKELFVCPLMPKLVVLIRYLCPSLYFWIMAFRAKKSTQ